MLSLRADKFCIQQSMFIKWRFFRIDGLLKLVYDGYKNQIWKRIFTDIYLAIRGGSRQGHRGINCWKVALFYF